MSAAFLRLLNLIDEPQALLSPRLLPRVLLGRRRPATVADDFVIDRQLSTTTSK